MKKSLQIADCKWQIVSQPLPAPPSGRQAGVKVDSSRVKLGEGVKKLILSAVAPEGRTDLRSFRMRTFRFRSSYTAINIWD
jgi:hypothetical protein